MKLIVAHDNKNGIGKSNTIPWFIKEELKYFKSITTQNKDSVVISNKGGVNRMVGVPKAYIVRDAHFHKLVSIGFKLLFKFISIYNMKTKIKRWNKSKIGLYIRICRQNTSS